jgi:hypothetical protein
LVCALDLIGLEAYVRAETGGPGRPRDDRRAIARAFVAKAVLGLPSTTALRERLLVDASLRRVCGWERARKFPPSPRFPAPSENSPKSGSSIASIKRSSSDAS